MLLYELIDKTRLSVNSISLFIGTQLASCSIFSNDAMVLHVSYVIEFGDDVMMKINRLYWSSFNQFTTILDEQRNLSNCVQSAKFNHPSQRWRRQVNLHNCVASNITRGLNLFD